jgi:hypothetical protein
VTTSEDEGSDEELILKLRITTEHLRLPLRFQRLCVSLIFSQGRKGSLKVVLSHALKQLY